MDVPDVPGSNGPDRSQMRISDDDRHQVAEVLRRAAGEGRLEFDELDERLEAAYAAKVYADLVPILADLPEEAPGLPEVGTQESTPQRSTPSGPVTTHDTSITVMGGVTRTGVWQIGEKHTAFVFMGGADIDLRQAVFAAPETVINANVMMGGVDVVVNAHTRVIVEGIGIMGDYNQARDRVEPEFDASSPVVRVKGVALMGAVSVVRKQMPGEPRPKRSRGRKPLPPSPPHLGH